MLQTNSPNTNFGSGSGGGGDIETPISVANGGTGAADAAGARTNLGVEPTITTLAKSKGGFGASIASVGDGILRFVSGALQAIAQLGVSQGGTGADLSATGGSGHVLKQASAGAAVTVGALAAADIPSLDASKITTGTMATARLASGTADSNSYLRGNNFWAGLNASHLESGQVPQERMSTVMSLRSASTSYDLFPVDSNTYGQVIIIDDTMSANLVTVIRIKAGAIVNVGAPGGEYVTASPGSGECQVSITGGYFRITTGSAFSRYIGFVLNQIGRI